MKWINVNDKLPDCEQVIVCDFGKNVFEAFFSNGKFYLEYNPYARIYETIDTSITHWMPLPEPPK